ncbi:MAG: hypothetical protein K6E91_15105 [Butyrivibrio sp.]|nr:hypothetical protein [Butyrivibrio sp.]
MKKGVLGFLGTMVLLTSTACGADIKESDVDYKPVIYLYPQEDNTAVSVSLTYNGKLTDTIPEIKDGTWDVIANSDGTITSGEETYPYLFWEGKPDYQYDFYTGYCIRGKDTEAFFNNMLGELGLNKKEAEDFKNYWLPQMKNNAYNVISFQEKTYTENAKLKVTPEPDTTIRVFMAWYPSEKFVKIHPQLIEDNTRKGFTVVEWGGNKVK